MYAITQEKLITLLMMLIIIVVLYLIIKKTFKIALTILGIIIIFQVGFMLTGDDLNERFFLGKYLDDATNTKVISFFNDFRQKGKEIAIINQDKVYESILDGVGKGAEHSITQVKKLDIDLLAENLAKQIYNNEIEIDKEELKELISSNIPNLNDEDINLILNKVEEYKETGK